MGERPTGNRTISADHVSDKAENIPLLTPTQPNAEKRFFAPMKHAAVDVGWSELIAGVPSDGHHLDKKRLPRLRRWMKR
jgi:hypothetical protein